MMVETWAGPTRPSRTGTSGRSSLIFRMWVIAAGVSTWLQKTEKFFTPAAFAALRTTAVGGVVVSNPIAKKTTSRSGLAFASSSASMGE